MRKNYRLDADSVALIIMALDKQAGEHDIRLVRAWSEELMQILERASGIYHHQADAQIAKLVDETLK